MIKDLFAIPVWHENLNLTKSNLYEEIKIARAKKDPSSRNYTSFFSDIEDNLNDRMQGVDWSELQEHIIRCGEKYIQDVFPQAPPRKIKVSSIWWNLYGLNNHHCWHVHPGCLLSGTYFVHMDKLSSPISFKSPIAMLLSGIYHNKYGKGTRWTQSVSIKPKTSDLLIWPSWLEHTVFDQTQLSDNLRCTISFNLIQY